MQMNLPCVPKLVQGACFIAFAFGLFKCCYCNDDAEYPELFETNEHFFSENINTVKSNSNVILVSTLNGDVVALDPEDSGKVLWTENTGPGPLLSSTISNIKITYDGQPIRLVPSLKGGLYKFDGEVVEPFPITAESLLSTSVKLTDQSIITGGNELRTYGINPKNGQVKYICEMSKCMRFENESESLEENTLVIKRRTQTVRAIDPMTGAEKWNFSVGNNEALFISSSCQLGDQTKNVNSMSLDLNPNCYSVKNEPLKNINHNYDIKFVVPEGIVCAVDKTNPNNILWKKKFSSPVVNAWEIKDQQILDIDLFDGRVVPALNPAEENTQERKPFMYLGLYHKQLYIQESSKVEKRMAAAELSDLSSDKIKLKFPWKPFIATASFKTLAKNSKDKAKLLLGEPSVQTALAIRHDSCDIENGYYLFSDHVSSDNEKKLIANNRTVFVDNSEYVVINSLWYWWKEVLAISIFSSVMMHLLFTRHTLKKLHLVREASVSNSDSVLPESGSSLSLKSCDDTSINESDKESQKSTEFVSRYATEFQHIRCLGRGGFGVVFEAKNLMDDCVYAVKRIRLPDREDDREKVMREVKALAKLDHPGIVRYYNSWKECPPPGWQELEDKKLFDKDDDDTFLSSQLESTVQSSNFQNSVQSDIYSTKTDDLSIADLKCDYKLLNDKNWLAQDDDTDSNVVTFEHESEDNNEYSKNSSNVESRPRTLNLKEVPKKKWYLYIQMQLCKKETLKDWMNENKTRSKMEILEIFDQILSAIQYVHEDLQLMHRDIKPSNIFFSMDNYVKVGDFGLVTALTSNQEDCIRTPINEKNSKRIHTDQVGTQLYMSPEQILRQSYSHKVDLFSLGLILFELLVPFSTSMERVDVMKSIREQNFPKDFQKNFCDECGLLRKILSHNPTDRPEAVDIKAALHEMHSEFQVKVPKHVRNNSRTFSTSSNDSISQ